MNDIDTVFLECPICKFLNEIEDPSVISKVFAGKAYGGEIVNVSNETQELIFCEECTTTIWPKEYAVKTPKILKERPKKIKKKRLTSKKKKRIMSPSKDKNEDI
tara:strand:+ start:851 stop:1162 length:312 start_codon:yes stop_codon:yes gene_type:complete